MPPDDLAKLVAGELFRPPPAAAERLADEIRRRHGEGVAAVLFYGSCLRRGTAEGVLDFYVIVDAYRAAYRSRWLTLANAALPPNVFYLEIDSDLGPLRCKYAVMSSDDFELGVRGGLRSSTWARFCQPVLAVWVRDENTRVRVGDAVAEAVATAVDRVVWQMPESEGVHRFDAERLWQRLFQETYSAELRTESAETIRGLYDADPERYQRAAQAAIDRLESRGGLRIHAADPARQGSPPGSGEFAVETDRTRTRRSWSVQRPIAKTVYVIALFKSIATFGDWLPYVLWKLERHSGRHVTLTERQRRHPLIWGWPLLFRVIWRRELH